MNTDIIAEVARATLDSSIAFPEVVRRLVETGVEYYHVDYVALRKCFYSAAGDVVTTPITYEGLPGVAAEFDLAALRLRFSTVSSAASTTATLPAARCRPACRAISRSSRAARHLLGPRRRSAYRVVSGGRAEFQIMLRWDILCRVVDNYGDVGVCWRLASQLANEHSQSSAVGRRSADCRAYLPGRVEPK